MKKITLFLFIGIISITQFFLFGCTFNKGKYYVSSDYIIATASLSGKIENLKTGEFTYMVDIKIDSDITLNYIKYKCELYKDDKVIETFEDELKMNSLYSDFIPLKTKKEYDHAKVVCSGWSNENPENFMKICAKSEGQMQQCGHENFIFATITSYRTNNKKDYLVINYSSNTSLTEFRFYYDKYVTISGINVKVCPLCGYYEII